MTPETLSWIECSVCYVSDYNLKITVEYDAVEGSWSWSAAWLTNNHYETEPFAAVSEAKGNAARWFHEWFLPKYGKAK